VLVLSRKKDQKIRLLFNREALEHLLSITPEDQDAEVLLTIVKIRTSSVRIGITADRCVRAVRSEIPVEKKVDADVDPRTFPDGSELPSG